MNNETASWIDKVTDKGTIVFYHGPSCADGFTAAWAAWKKLGDYAEYIPLHPDELTIEDLGVLTGDRIIYFLDLCPTREILTALASHCCRVRVIDHHASAPARFRGILPVEVFFDPTKCGARLAWEYFHPETMTPRLIDYVEDRDLWKWTISYSRAVSVWLGTREKTFASWSDAAECLMSPDREWKAVGQGKAMLLYQQQLVAALAKGATLTTVAGHLVPTVNTSVLQSEVGEALALGHPFAACWSEKNGKRIYSLRSDANGLDLVDVVVPLGGGGHQRAAGFSVPVGSE